MKARFGGAYRDRLAGTSITVRDNKQWNVVCGCCVAQQRRNFAELCSDNRHPTKACRVCSACTGQNVIAHVGGALCAQARRKISPLSLIHCVAPIRTRAPFSRSVPLLSTMVI